MNAALKLGLTDEPERRVCLGERSEMEHTVRSYDEKEVAGPLRIKIEDLVLHMSEAVELYLQPVPGGRLLESSLPDGNAKTGGNGPPLAHDYQGQRHGKSHNRQGYCTGQPQRPIDSKCASSRTVPAGYHNAAGEGVCERFNGQRDHAR